MTAPISVVGNVDVTLGFLSVFLSVGRSWQLFNVTTKTMPTRISHMIVAAFLLIATPALSSVETEGSGGDQPIRRYRRNIFYQVDRVSVSFGGGYNYAGIGASLTVYAEENLGVFVSGGHNFLGDTNYTLGLKYRMLSGRDKRVNPYVTLMYGFHGAIAVGRNHALSRSYKGATIGAGIDQKYRRGSLGYFSAGLLMAFRGQTYKDHLSYLDENDFARSSMVSPVVVTIGYHFVLN